MICVNERIDVKGKAECCPKRSIINQMDILNDKISILDGLVCDLQHKLEVICAPRIKQPPIVSDKLDDNSYSTLYSGLFALESRLNEATGKIQNILNTLDL